MSQDENNLEELEEAKEYFMFVKEELKKRQSKLNSILTELDDVDQKINASPKASILFAGSLASYGAHKEELKKKQSDLKKELIEKKSEIEMARERLQIVREEIEALNDK